LTSPVHSASRGMEGVTRCVELLFFRGNAELAKIALQLALLDKPNDSSFFFLRSVTFLFAPSSPVLTTANGDWFRLSFGRFIFFPSPMAGTCSAFSAATAVRRPSNAFGLPPDFFLATWLMILVFHLFLTPPPLVVARSLRLSSKPPSIRRL